MSDMELIERYLGVMAEHLPEKTKDDVINEIRANIMDMLPDEPTENDIRTALEKLGDPLSLANEYRRDKKYLIGPAVYDSYIAVLKLGVGIAAIAFAFIALLGNIVRPSDGSFDVSADIAVLFSTDLVIDIIASALQGALHAFVWITIIFVSLDRAGAAQGNFPFRKKKWTIDDLPQTSGNDKSRITCSEAVMGFVFTIVFAALLLTQPHIVGWYEKQNGMLILTEPFINVKQLGTYSFTIILFTVLQLVVSIYKFIVKRWNLPLAVLNTAHNIALCVFVYVLCNDKKIINTGFISQFADKTGWTMEKAMTNLQNFLTGFVILFILISTIDSISGFVKSRRLEKLPSININIM